MTEAEKERIMTVKKAELGPREEAEPTTTEEVGQASRHSVWSGSSGIPYRFAPPG